MQNTKIISNSVSELTKNIKSNKILMVFVYVGASLVVIYTIGKIMKIVGTTISEFHDLKSAIKN
jgi:hypothetical protein